MNVTNSLKTAYEKLPREIKFAFSPMFVRLMVNNREFRKTFQELAHFGRASQDEQKAIQFQKLKDMLRYAYRYVPYYHDLFAQYSFDPDGMRSPEDIAVLPLLEKSEAIQLGDRLYSQEKGLQYYKTFTGGSSGQSMTVLMEKDVVYRERAFAVSVYSKYGFDPRRSRTVAFIGHNRDSDYYYSPLKNEISISPFRLFRTDQFNAICDDIERFGATFMIGYPSSIYSFAKMCDMNGRSPGIQKVVYSSENCGPEEKMLIERVFNCSVSSIYGHTERACFGEIDDDCCTFHRLYGYTELIPTETESEYRIVCTGFINRKMPLIRYATDDVVQLRDDGTMHLTGHRQSEVRLISKNGQQIFKGAMTLHMELLKKVKCYQYYQNVPGKAELRLVENMTLSEEDMGMIRRYLERRCEGLLDVEIRLVDEIQLTKRGKYQWAINDIKE